MVLGIAVDLSALSYLLRLILWVLTEQASLFDRFLVGSDHAGRRRAVSRGSVYSRSEKRAGVGNERHPFLAKPSDRRGCLEVGRCWKRALFLLREAFRSERQVGVRSERRSSLARPFGRRLDRPSSPGVARRLQRCLLGRAFAGKQVHEGPRVFEPDRSPRAPG